MQITNYDKAALEELHRWKHPQPTRLSAVGERAEAMIAIVADRLSTGVLEDVTDVVMPLFNGAADRLVSKELILLRFRQHGHPGVRSIGDIRELSLKEVEGVVGTKRFREIAKGAGEGGVAGFYGLPVLPADVAALTTLALRSMAIFGYSYGFEANAKAESAFRLGILNAATSFGPNAKRDSITALRTLGKSIAERDAARRAVDAIMKRLPAQMVTRMTALKAEDVVPVLGAATGASFNGWLLRAVAVNARFAYRERFLERKYGPDVLDAYGL